MELREKATRLATQLEGRCTCAMTEVGVDCPWCEVFYAVLQGYAPSSRPRGDQQTSRLQMGALRSGPAAAQQSLLSICGTVWGTVSACIGGGFAHRSRFPLGVAGSAVSGRQR